VELSLGWKKQGLHVSGKSGEYVYFLSTIFVRVLTTLLTSMEGLVNLLSIRLVIYIEENLRERDFRESCGRSSIYIEPPERLQSD
jgi:hypothetical protein